MENVSVLIKHDVFHNFVNTLKRRDYYVWHDVVDCDLYGVPKTRKRTVLLASKFGPIYMIKKTHKMPRTFRQTIGDLSPIGAGEFDPKDRLHMCQGASEINVKRIKASKPGGTWRDWPKQLRAKCHQRSTGQTLHRWVHITMVGFGLVQLLSCLNSVAVAQLCCHSPWRQETP